LPICTAPSTNFSERDWPEFPDDSLAKKTAKEKRRFAAGLTGKAVRLTDAFSATLQF
jgi:hypothetical protein